MKATTRRIRNHRRARTLEQHRSRLMKAAANFISLAAKSAGTTPDRLSLTLTPDGNMYLHQHASDDPRVRALAMVQAGVQMAFDLLDGEEPPEALVVMARILDGALKGEEVEDV